jgi:uncharacterized sulfatase
MLFTSARARFAAGIAFLVIAAVVTGNAAAAEDKPTRPNILWITAEDMSPHVACYGDDFAVTPTIDRLAKDGVRYTRAFAAAPVCTPARSCLITGMYPVTLGSQHLRGEITKPEQIRCFPEFLREAGYYCTNNVKEDYNFRAPDGCWDESSNTAHWRGRKRGQPFFAVFNFMTTHQSRIRFDDAQFEKLTGRLTQQQRHDPAKVPLPPYYPDTPVVRNDVARLYDLITAMDYQVGDVLQQLEEDGLADDTIVFFYSDHGDGMPRHKRWVHDSGLHVPLVIRFPEKYQHLAPGRPGSTSDRMVVFADFGPTVLSLVGLPVPEYAHGRAFLGPQAGPPRDFVVGVRDRVDEVYEMSRSIRDGRYRYIRNFMPHRPRMQHSDFSERTPTRKELRRLAAAGELKGAVKDFMSSTKPIEELYDTQTDPHEVHNLAESPEHQVILARLRQQLFDWMIARRDTGLLAEVDMWARAGDDTILQMAADDGRFPVERILKVADRVGRPQSTCVQLAELLTDEDPAIRYWAAVGLICKGDGAKPAEAALLKTLEDPSPPVRFAAAEALCGIGRADRAVAALTSGLNSEDFRVRLSAAISLVAVGEAARSALPQMQKARQAPARGTYPLYTKWALDYAVSRFEG